MSELQPSMIPTDVLSAISSKHISQIYPFTRLYSSSKPTMNNNNNDNNNNTANNNISQIHMNPILTSPRAFHSNLPTQAPSLLTPAPDSLQEKSLHYQYLTDFRVEQCPLFLQHKCTQHRPFTCFYWHFQNQRRRRPTRRKEGTFNYSPDHYCPLYDENTGMCSDGDDCLYLHRTAGDTERRYHLRYYKTSTCVHETDSTGCCVKNGIHCAFAHGTHDMRNPVYDIREIQTLDEDESPALYGSLEREKGCLTDDLRWQNSSFVLTYYKTQPCPKPPKLCRQGYACPFFHNNKDKRRTPKLFKYRSTPCPHVKINDEWGDPRHCDGQDSCLYCHTRTEQQFHIEIYKSTKCNDVQQTGYCPRGAFCAFAHNETELNAQRELTAAPLSSSASDSLVPLGSYLEPDYLPASYFSQPGHIASLPGPIKPPAPSHLGVAYSAGALYNRMPPVDFQSESVPSPGLADIQSPLMMSRPVSYLSSSVASSVSDSFEGAQVVPSQDVSLQEFDMSDLLSEPAYPDIKTSLLATSPAAQKFLLRFSNQPGSTNPPSVSLYSSSAPSHSDMATVTIPLPINPHITQPVQEPRLVMKDSEDTLQHSMQSLSMSVDAKMCKDHTQPNPHDIGVTVPGSSSASNIPDTDNSNKRATPVTSPLSPTIPIEQNLADNMRFSQLHQQFPPLLTGTNDNQISSIFIHLDPNNDVTKDFSPPKNDSATDLLLQSASAPPKTGFFMESGSYEAFSSKQNPHVGTTTPNSNRMVAYPGRYGSSSNVTNIINSPAANHLNMIENEMLRDELKNAQMHIQQLEWQRVYEIYRIKALHQQMASPGGGGQVDESQLYPSIRPSLPSSSYPVIGQHADTYPSGLNTQTCLGNEQSQDSTMHLPVSNFDSVINFQYNIHSSNVSRDDNDAIPTETVDPPESTPYREFPQFQKSSFSDVVAAKLLCLICSNNERDAILEPCLHFACCNECASQDDFKCPNCNSEVKRVTQVKVQPDNLYN